MSIGPADDEEIPLDLASALGATQADISAQSLTIYIPNKDCDGKEFGYQRKWVLETVELLTRIGGGATILPAAEGIWFNPETKSTVWESPVMVYTFVIPQKLRDELPNLRTLLHKIGRETNQGEVVIIFDNEFYRVKSFDPPVGGSADAQEDQSHE